MSDDGLDVIVLGAGRRAGLTHGTCHHLRHTCLTRLREAGMALEAVQAQAGHRSIESTPVYLRLVLELLSRTGMRVGELCALEADAVVHIGEGWWLRVPLGKLHDNRYVPLHPQLLPLLDDCVRITPTRACCSPTTAGRSTATW